MAQAFSRVALIYNPNSTSGRAEQFAKRIQRTLSQKAPKLKVELDPTARAGHGEELARALANKHGKNVLIISVSGDGGYHDIVNGVLAVPGESRPVCAVYPAGNANDHHSTVVRRDLLAAIIANEVERIDVVSASWKRDGKLLKRYAHSYIGLGITPVVAAALNQTQLNPIKELQLTAKALLKFRGTRLVVKGEPHRYMSLLFMNIPRMAKVFTVSPAADLTDDRFELVEIRTRSLWRLALAALRGAVLSIPATDRLRRFTFATTKATLMQLDGEVVRLPPQTEVIIKSEPAVLRVVR